MSVKSERRKELRSQKLSRRASQVTAGGESSYARRLMARRRAQEGAEYPRPRPLDFDYVPTHHPRIHLGFDPRPLPCEDARIYRKFGRFHHDG